MTTRTGTCRWLAVPVVLTGLLAGCGGTKNYANDAKPAAPIAVSAAVTDSRVNISPGHVGGGGIRLTVANLSHKSLELLVDPIDADGEGGRSGPIAPQGTAQLQLDVHQGSYRVKTSRGSIASTVLKVSAQRGNSQNELLLP